MKIVWLKYIVYHSLWSLSCELLRQIFSDAFPEGVAWEVLEASGHGWTKKDGSGDGGAFVSIFESFDEPSKYEHI